ncbi:MAG TPA: leucine-rich repeat protein, partial [Pyrinomonadaceae bacterium]|nr:leucine-rich repeat protein [Pyrinomonadaceae bacterium]
MSRNEAYREAEKKIEEARRSGDKSLDLSGEYDADSPKLDELPESLSQLTQLESLNLSDNQLTELPESLSRLTQLKSLNLSHNRLTELPEWMGQLARLNTLKLSGNRLTELPESLGQLTQLVTFDVLANQLTELPESLGELTKLEWVDLSGNQLSSLSEFPVRWHRLTHLYIGSAGMGNPIGQLPSWLRSCTGLLALGAAYCELTSVPEWIGELASLSTLWLNDNHLVDLPPSLAVLEISSLHLDRNPFNPELAAAVAEGTDAVKRYLRAKARAQVVLNEAKLILIGEGEVGKSCLLGALRGEPWEEGRLTT